MSGRTKNSVRNIFYGSFNRILSIIIPFIIRTAIIYVLGEEYLGLNSLFTSILQVLSITELGFGTAIAASMYQPIADNDTDTVSALLNVYRKIYKVVGLGILLCGLIILPFLPHLINGKPPENINIYTLFILYLANTVCGYLFFAYKVTLIWAHQRSDLTEIIGSITRLITGIIQIIVIMVFKNIMLYVFLNVVCTFLYNMGCSYMANKHFPQYTCSGNITKKDRKKIIRDVSALAIQKIGNTVSLSLDTIIISIFLNLNIVAIYGNYNYIIGAISTFINLIYGSITASIGNSIVRETKEKNYKDLKNFMFLNSWLIGWCSCCFICIFQPFMKIWMGNNRLLPMGIVILLVIYFYISQIRKLIQTYKDAAGIWWEDKFRPIFGCIVNLSFNIILVKYYGVYGVVLSTIISYLFVEMPWETQVLFKIYFKQKTSDYYMSLLIMTIKIIFSIFVTYYICSLLKDGLVNILLRLLLCLTIPNVIIVLLNIKNPSMVWTKKIILNILKSN